MTLAHLYFRSVTALAVVLCASFSAVKVSAQDAIAGKTVYTTPAVAGQKSCSDASCHTVNPLNNQNRILKGADDPGAIGFAISSITQMAFLSNPLKLTSTQIQNLAAYIGNPSAAAGAPVAQVSPASLTFASTVVGNTAASQSFAISNTGTANLVVTSVASSNSEFSLVSSCGTIAVGASCNVSVGFSPASTGARSGTVTVTHNAVGVTSTVALFGTGEAAAVPGIQVTPLSLNFGAVAAGSYSGGLPVTVNSVGGAPLAITALSDTGAVFPVIGGSCVVGTPVAAGGSCTILLRFAPTAAGAQGKVLTISHNASTAAVSVNLAGTGVASTGNVKTMVEYLYAPLNYFFITSRDDDKTALDKISDFQRTGLSFPVYATQVANSKAISRFYFDQIAVHASRGSHFYTLLDSDKSALIALNPSNAAAPRLPFNEGVDSWAFLPIVSGPGGSCGSGQIPVYRLFRGAAKFPDDPNHRFTTSQSIYDSFVALGWDGEGVNFCVPQP